MSLILIFSHSVYSKSLEKLLDRIDRLHRSDSSEVQMEMQIQTPNWKRTLKMKVWTKGLERTFITILAPKKDKGISTLKRDNDMWNFFPKINKVIKVPPSMMMGSWMGSDLTNDDLVKENTYRKDFNSKFGVEDQNYYRIISTPKPETVTVWGKVEILVDKKNEFPIKQIYYDENMEKIRVMEMKEIKKIGGKTIPTVLELVPLKKKGNKTIIKYTAAEFNKEISDSVFSKRNLQKRR
jgi:hypothetical protein